MKTILLTALILSPFTAFAGTEAGNFESKDGSTYFSCKVISEGNGVKVIEPLTPGHVFPNGAKQLTVKENGCSALGKYRPWGSLKVTPKEAATQMANLTLDYRAGDTATQTASTSNGASESAPNASK